MAVSADAAQAGALVGFLEQFSTEMKTDRHLGPVLNYAHAEMSTDFIGWMSLQASGSGHARFHHVYEWGEVGNPDARLWRDVLVGRGANRLATWTWRASKKVVPVDPEAADKGVKAVHIFTWKAPVMEYSTDIHIHASEKGLAFFTENSEVLGYTKADIIVRNPGGPAVKGSFTAAYAEWWGGGGAATAFETRIRRILENDLGKMPIEQTVARYRRPRTKKFIINTIGSYESAVEAGRTAATQYMISRSRDYLAGARAREAINGDISE